MKFKKIYIEISDICGLNCYFCPAPKGVRGIMPLFMFNRAIVESKKHTNLVALHILGDPLKMKNIKDYLALAYKNHLSVEITTSGIYLDEFALLLNPPIRQVNISLDAVFTLPEAIREKAIAKILSFCAFRQRYKSDTFINIRIQDRNNNKAMIDMLERYFNVSIIGNKTRVGVKTIIVIREPFLWNIDISQQQDSIKVSNIACYGLQDHIGILSNGDVVPCCIDVMGRLRLGNIMNDSIKDIVESPRARAILEGFKRNILVEDVCKICDFRKKFDKNTKKIL